MMLVHPKEEVVLSSVGWVDGGSLWALEPKSCKITTYPMSDAKYLSLHNGDNEHFAICHHYDGTKFEISAHRFSNPSQAVARIAFTGAGHTHFGDASVWAQLPRHYICYLNNLNVRDFVVLSIKSGGTASVSQLEWYDDSYDKLYQGVVDVKPVPDTPFLLFSVQRSSTLVQYDVSTRSVVRRIELAARYGNPRLLFCRSRPEL